MEVFNGDQILNITFSVTEVWVSNNRMLLVKVHLRPKKDFRAATMGPEPQTRPICADESLLGLTWQRSMAGIYLQT